MGPAMPGIRRVTEPSNPVHSGIQASLHARLDTAHLIWDFVEHIWGED